jgi:uncharacterized protein YfaS (alpha-2-macroglobulin family)
VIPPTQPRIDAFIQTDKPIYKPGDVMFTEVYLFEAFDKTPFTE